MDIQLKELIETIKTEGIATADSKAAEIIAQAEKKAKEIKAKAESDAERILSDAKREIARNEQTSRDALAQAGRDLVLNLRQRIVQLFDSVLANATKESLQGKGLEDAVTSLISAWSQKGSTNIEVLLPKAELDKIEKSLKAKLADAMKKGVTLKPVPQIDAGFRIGEKDGSAYFDFSSEGIAEILSEYLNPKLAEILEKAVRGEK